MAFNVPEPLPPTTILSSKAISQPAAQDFLAAYLDRAATDPSLQPNATISEHGPVSRTTGAPNLTLHTLKRVQAGLAGQVLGQDLSLQAHGGGGRRFASEQTGDEEDDYADRINANDQGWEDRRRFEVAPEDDDGATTETQFDFEKETVIQVNEDGMPISSSGKVDKEERKRKKKERRQAEKRAKAEVMEDDDRP
ncbi:hypothetical protein V8E54_006970 [Elaphomyces granulatus]